MFYISDSEADERGCVHIYSTPFSDICKQVNSDLMSDAEIIMRKLLFSG
jgi:hypothetical protein